MSTYKHLVERNKNIVNRLVKFSGLEEDFVQNIVRFSKCLIKPGTGSIDGQMFHMVMSNYFDLMDQFCVTKIFNQLTKHQPDAQVAMEDFAKIVCTFFSDNLDIKIDHVFRLYDYDNDGLITSRKVAGFVKSCSCITDTDDSDKDETYFDLCMMAIDTLKIGTQGINLEQFREKCKENHLIMFLLAQSLPPSDTMDTFREQIEGKSNIEMKETFGKIRSDMLFEPTETMQYYPITLDIP